MRGISDISRIKALSGRRAFDMYAAPGENRKTRKPSKGSWYRMYVTVRDNNVDQALRVLKKKLQREGVYREMKMRRFFEKPSEKRAREQAAAIRRARKLERKRMERDGITR